VHAELPLAGDAHGGHPAAACKHPDSGVFPKHCPEHSCCVAPQVPEPDVVDELDELLDELVDDVSPPVAPVPDAPAPPLPPGEVAAPSPVSLAPSPPAPPPGV